MTRQLLTALQPRFQKDDNYVPLIEEDNFEDDYCEMEYPTGLIHLIHILFKTDEKKMLALSNPDGYFYLYYIKTCIKMFLCIILSSSLWMSLICFDSVSKKYPSKSWIKQISLPNALFNENIYQASLVFTLIISMIAYYFLYDFCYEMS